MQTAGERGVQTDGSARQGLKSLGEISALIPIIGALTVAASLSAVIWRRRTRLAAMKTWGYDHIQLWRALLLESVILLVIGCVETTILGLYARVCRSLVEGYHRFPASFL